MNKFYERSKLFQWVVGLLMLFAAGVCFGYWIELMQRSFFAILFIFIITPIGQFLMSPFMKLTGVYKYLSPMLLIYAPSKKKYDLHNGTSFDYLFSFRRNRRGVNWQSTLLIYYIEGLLEIIREIENSEVPESIEIRGSSYFFSGRTAQRLGFKTKETGIFEKLNFIINYLDLVWMYSLSKGKLHFPGLKDVKTATTTGKKLKEKKDNLLRLKTYLKKQEPLADPANDSHSDS